MEEREDHIQKVFRQLLDRGLSGQQLWDVVSALRGPDNGLWDLKDATTNVIRYTLGFRQTTLHRGVTLEAQNVFCCNPDSEIFVEIRKNINLFGHFESHCKKAFDALGLKWTEVNR